MSLKEAIAAAEKEFAQEAEADSDAASAPDHAAWANAQAYLLQLEQELREKNAPMSIPAIGPGPQGTVDLHWKNDQFELLINVSGKNTTATFYAENRDTSLYVKGRFDTQQRSAELFLWVGVATGFMMFSIGR